nr:Chain P, Dodecapeptide: KLASIPTHTSPL [synthetic construct]
KLASIPTHTSPL